MDFNQFYATFLKANLARCNGPFQCANKPNLYWAAAIAEEAGEVAGVIKKLDRGMTIRDFEKTKNKILSEMGKPHFSLPEDLSDIKITSAKYEPSPEDDARATTFIHSYWLYTKKKDLKDELADVFIYLHLAAQKNNIDLLSAVKDKFNQVSKEMGCPEFII